MLLQLAPKTASLEEIFIELTSGKTNQETAAEEIEATGEDAAETVQEEINDKKEGEE